MSGKFEKKDLRIQRTHKALITAFIVMLKYQNFNEITVNGLCEEALISRATFYAHFNDKYDLLKYWLDEVKKEIIKDVTEYEALIMAVNQFIYDNKKTIKNIIKNANHEVLEIIQDFMTAIVDLSIKREVSNATSPNHIILLNFCTGGLYNLLLWQVKNNFPPEVDMLNTYLYEMLECITEWDAKQEH